MFKMYEKPTAMAEENLNVYIFFIKIEHFFMPTLISNENKDNWKCNWNIVFET